MRKPTRSRKINWFLIGILALPSLAIGAYFWATAIIAGLENYRSPLPSGFASSGETLGAPLTRKVVIVLFDALRYDTSTDATLMPTLNEMRLQGASALMTSRPPSFSAPGWTTLLTGAWPDINDSQPFNPPDEYTVRAFTQEDIFALAESAGLKTAVSGYSWFGGMLAGSGVDASFYTLGEDDQADQQVVSAALPWLEQDYQLILIHIDQIDFAGHHEGGPQSPAWDAAAARSDAMLAQIVSRLDFGQDTLIIVSDHGQIEKGGHGGNEPVTMLEPFVAVGAGILPGSYDQIHMVDVSPTLAVLLGTGIPAANQGRPLLEMLDLSAEYSSRVIDLLKAQQAKLLETYSSAINQPVRPLESEAVVAGTQLAMERMRMGRLAQERIWRNMIALFFAIVPGYLLFVRKEKGVLWGLAAVVIYLLVFNLRYLLIDKNTLGLSWIPGITEFILYIAVTSGVALIIAWLLPMLGTQAFRQGTLTAARRSLGLIWFILYFLSIPILLNFAVNGLVPEWTLPEFTVQYLGFFALVQALFVAGVGLLLVGASGLLGWILDRKRR
jgi:hypothetical protein